MRLQARKYLPQRGKTDHNLKSIRIPIKLQKEEKKATRRKI